MRGMGGVPGYTTTPGVVGFKLMDGKPGSVVTPVPVGGVDKGGSLTVPTLGDIIDKPYSPVTPRGKVLAGVMPGPDNGGDINSVS